MSRAHKIIETAVEKFRCVENAIVCAVHDRALSGKAVENESCAFGGSGDIAEQLCVRFTGRDFDERFGHHWCGVIPFLAWQVSTEKKIEKNNELREIPIASVVRQG